MFFSKNEPSSNKPSQIIACIDMDAYYAQAEARRLGFLDSVPLGVKQWNGLIAVSYSARKYGVSRFTTVEEAQSLCPKIRLPHVDTYKVDENGKIVLSSIADKFRAHNRAVEKVTLDYYRKESKKIFEVIKGNFKKVEIASIDEVFIDLTEEINKEISSRHNHEKKQWEGIVLGEENPQIDENNEEEIRMLIGADLINKTRKEIYEKYKYTCSAGISYNKLLAKLASGINKPNNQTIILRRLMPFCIGECKISKLRLFGGKVSQIFEKKSINLVSDALKLTREDLKGLFNSDEDVDYIYERLRGVDYEEVKTAESIIKGLKTKTILSQKTMGKKPAKNMSDLEVCVDLILLDLIIRLSNFYDETHALPNLITMGYYDNVEMTNKTKSREIHLFWNENEIKLSLEKTIKELLFSISHVVFPCFSISFGLRNFKNEKGIYMYSLSEYCKKASEEKNQVPETELNGKEKKICEKCGISIIVDEYDVHLDYHLACDIDKTLNPNKKKYKSESAKRIDPILQTKSQPSKQTKKQSDTIKETKNKKIEDYFILK